MKRPVHETILRGALGGLIAGAVVAAWFFFVDLAAGAPFRSPAILAGTLLGIEPAEPTFRLVALYTVLHFGVFLFLGILTTLILEGLGITPGWLVGLLFGVGVLDAVFYSALLLTGYDVLTILPGLHVLGANAAGGVVMMSYLHWALRSEAPLGFATLKSHPLIQRGLVTGLIGAGAVALWFLLIDIVTGQPFRTPAALGSALLLGADTQAQVQMTFGVIASYTVIHLLAFAVAGTVLVVAAEQLERAPGLWLLFTLAFIVLEAVGIGTLGLLSDPVLGTPGVLEVTLGNLVAVGSMGAWIWRTHPTLRRKLLDQPVATRV